MFGSPRLRASRSIIAVPQPGLGGDQILFYNFLTQCAAHCSREALFWISEFADWHAVEQVAAGLPNMDRREIDAQIEALLDNSILIAEHSAEHKLDDSFVEKWEWGLAAGLYHFSMLNNIWMPPEEGIRRQQERAENETPPPLYWRDGNNAIQCPSPDLSSIEQVLRLMRSRRTNRVDGDPAITLAALTDCLYAGMAIIGEVETPTGKLPLQMTPAGGARNPFEAFVLARNVEGLDAGVYHYSAAQHTLACISERLPERLGDIIAGQDWADAKPALILLVGVLERLMWKYEDPNAYRVALIEAGHKGQNIALAATAHGLSACPTAALNHQFAASVLGLDQITHTPFYAITLSKPGTYDFEIHPLQ